MSEQSSQKYARWTGIEARGKKVVFLNGKGFWNAVECETEAQAQHLVLEIEYLINSRIQAAVKSAEFNRLCRAGD